MSTDRLLWKHTSRFLSKRARKNFFHINWVLLLKQSCVAPQESRPWIRSVATMCKFSAPSALSFSFSSTYPSFSIFLLSHIHFPSLYTLYLHVLCSSSSSNPAKSAPTKGYIFLHPLSKPHFFYYSHHTYIFETSDCLPNYRHTRNNSPSNLSSCALPERPDEASV